MTGRKRRGAGEGSIFRRADGYYVGALEQPLREEVNDRLWRVKQAGYRVR